MFIRSHRLLFADADATGGNVEPKPIADMTPEERIEFEQGAKRKAQDKLKAFNGKTPADLAALEGELETLRKEKLTEQERAVDEAREATRAEVLGSSASQTVDAVLAVALRGRMSDAAALLTLDKSTFVVDGKADIEAITKWADENSSSKEEKQQRHVNVGGGTFDRVTTTDRETGQAEANKRFGKNN